MYSIYVYVVAKEFWIETKITKMKNWLNNDGIFTWKEDLGFSTGHLSRNFLRFKEHIEIQVSLCIYAAKGKQFSICFVFQQLEGRKSYENFK